MIDVTKLLKKGKNTLACKVADGGGAPCGLLFAIRLVMADGSEKIIISDNKTLASETLPKVWPVENADASYVPAEIIGKQGIAPWGANYVIKPADKDMGQLPFPF